MNETTRKPRKDRGMPRGAYGARIKRAAEKPETENPNDDDLEQQYDEGSGQFVAARVDPLVEQSEFEIDRLVGDLTMAGGKIKLSIKPANSVSYQHLTEMPVRDFSIENVKSVFGGGKFQADFVTVQGQTYRRGILFEIAGTFKGTVEEQAERSILLNGRQQTTATTAAQPMSGEMSLAQLFAFTQQRSDQFMQLMMTQQREMMGFMSQALTRRDGSSGIAELTPLIAELVKSKAPSFGALETIETLRAAKSLLMERRDDDEDSGFGKLLQVAAPALAAMFQPKTAPPMMPIAAPPGPAYSAPPPLPATPPTMGLQQLRYVFPILQSAAANGTPPESYADVIDDLLDETQYAQLIEVLKTETWAQTLFGVADLPHKPWFAELRAGLLDEDGGAESAPVVASESPAQS